MGSLENLTFKGGFTENQYRGGRLPKKRGAWQEGVVFLRGQGRGEGGWDPNVHYASTDYYSYAIWLSLNTYNILLKAAFGNVQ